MWSRCSPWTNHRVGAPRLSGVQVVRHDRWTPRTTPTVSLALPAPHALAPACSICCPRTHRMRPGDLSFSTTHSPCTPADAVCWLKPLAGLIQRPLPAGGHRSEQSDARATPLLGAASGWHHTLTSRSWHAGPGGRQPHIFGGTVGLSSQRSRAAPLL